MIPKIIIAARSMLASNVYKLLLSHINAEIIVANRFETARPWFFRKGRIDLAIFHSDIFAPRFENYWRKLENDEPFSLIPKIFICKSSPREKAWQEKLVTLPKSVVIERPFFPMDFEKLVKEVQIAK